MTRLRMSEALEPYDLTARTLAIEEYCSTDTFIADAVAWVGDARALPADLVDHIVAAYADSPQFDTVIDDALDGEVRF
jgi:hypothetical protein